MAIQDFVDGVRNYEFWTTFAVNDVKAKYRRSKLGELWITLTVALFIFMIGALYGSMFSDDGRHYFAYLAIGYIWWLFVSDCLNSGCTVIVAAKPYILQRDWPMSTFAMRLTYRQVLVILHQIIILPIVFWIIGYWPSIPSIGLSILGFLVTTYAAFWSALVLGVLTARFRDIPPIVSALLRMAFFATPIIWYAQDLGGLRYWMVVLNPFSYFLELIRNPLLGQPISSNTWPISFGLCVLITIIGILSLRITKNKIAYWL